MNPLTPKLKNGQSGDDGNHFLRTERLYVQVNPNELATIKAHAKNNGYNTTAQYVRQQAISAGITDNPMTLKRHYLECEFQLSKIGNNINQIARIANREQKLDRDMLRTLKTIEKDALLLLVEAQKKVEGNE